MQYGFNFNYRNISDEIFIAPRIGLEFLLPNAIIHLRTGLYNAHDFDYLKLPLTPDYQSQKSYHLVMGGKFQKGRFRFLGEIFYKNYWDLLERRPDGGYENTGIREVGGFAVGLQLTRKLESIVSGSLSYTFQTGAEKITARTIPTIDSFEASRIRELPDVGENFTPVYLRDHTLSLYLKITPFKRIKSKSPKKIAWIKNQYLAIEFSFLSQKPETSVTSVVKTTNSEGETRFLLEKESFNNTTTPPILKLNLLYGIPINKNIEIFVTFVNVLNYQNVLFYDYTITSQFDEGRDDLETYPYGRYGSEVVQAIPNIDTLFTVRGGIKIRY